MDETLKAIFAGKDNLLKLFELAENFHRKYSGYQIKNGMMWLYWCEPKTLLMEGFVPFPYEMNSRQAAEFVYGWLENVEYRHEPYTDGSVVKGFEFVADSFGDCMQGMKCDNAYVGVIIDPTWIVYGK